MRPHVWRCSMLHPSAAGGGARRFMAPAIIAAALFVSALSTAAIAAPETITLYRAQHEQTVDLLIADFEKATGIQVRVHTGEGPEVASQLLEEGKDSPADVYFTENSPELVLLEEKGLLAPVAAKTLSEIPARFSSP